MKKKTWFYAMALVCSMNLFTACSDDDDDMPKLPNTEITPESGNLAVTVNGTTATTGSAKFEAKNPSEAVLTLTNVIPGYAEVAVDVELQAQTDGSYKFAGEKELFTPPTAITRTSYAPVIMNVAVQGTVTTDGKATVTATTTLSESAQGNLAGTWNLSLQYPYTVGEFDMETFTTPQYSNPYPPIRLTWTAKNSDDLNAEQCALILTNLCSNLLAQVVQNVSLSTNSNLTASYYPQPIFDQQYNWTNGEWTQLDPANAMTTWMMNALLVPPTTTKEDAPNTNIAIYPRTWTASPTGLVSWYVLGDRLYLIPNITAILGQVSADQGTDISMDGLDLNAILSKLTELGIDQAALTAVLPQIMEWLTTGIPLKYEVTGDRLALYVDKEMVTPFMNLLLPALPGLWNKILEADPTGLAGMAIYLMGGGIEKIEDLQTIWENNTDDFSITLNLKK